MTTEEKWEFVNRLDEKYLLGGVTISEWTAFIVRDADIAFCAGAHLAVVFMAQAAIESHLRYEYAGRPGKRSVGFNELIDQSPLELALKERLHDLRRFRNRWVHVNDPHADQHLSARPELHEAELAAR